MKTIVYIVEDTGNSPGRVYGVLSDLAEAVSFADLMAGIKNTSCGVTRETVHTDALEAAKSYGDRKK